jgi:hypothetical protein
MGGVLSAHRRLRSHLSSLLEAIIFRADVEGLRETLPVITGRGISGGEGSGAGRIIPESEEGSEP